MFNVTLTGLDEFGTNDYWHAMQNGHFNRHELGLLYSENSAGKKPRYPEPRVIDRLINEVPNVAIHLCGRVVRDLINEAKVPQHVAEWIELVDRVQLNISATSWVPHRVAENLDKVNPKAQWIIQFRLGTENVQRCVDLNNIMEGRPHFLLDNSGGRGKLPAYWPSLKVGTMGAAGGLDPINVYKQLRLMEERNYFDEGFWIDAESGIRINDQWDWEEYEEFLDQVDWFKETISSTPEA